MKVKMKKILSFRESISKARWKNISVSTRKSICTKTTKDTRNSEEFHSIEGFASKYKELHCFPRLF